MTNNQLTETLTKNAILNWYHGTNEHVPVAELERLLADEVVMVYPNSPDPIVGIPAFRKWYADVLSKYFDETHVVEWWDISVDGNKAEAKVVVRWETRTWPVGERVSEYLAFLSHQRFVIVRDADSGRVTIQEKRAEAFEPTAPVYGPFATVGGPSGQCQDISQAVQAARNGDIAALRRWLDAGGNPNQYDAEGWTPLLAACVRGRSEAAALLLGNRRFPAMADLTFAASGALPIHFAGQSGDKDTAALILDAHPGSLNAVWNLNGHTLLLQAVFYGHLELARFALERGADTSITTARGLGAMELARQFQNQPMMDLILPHDSAEGDKKAYYQSFLKRIAPFVPRGETEKQAAADRLVQMITDGLAAAARDPGSVKASLGRIEDFVATGNVDVNRLGGALQQPPIVVAVTGDNGQPANPAVAEFREALVKLLLHRGADPTLNERHPMGVDAIIRAAVFNHLSILKAMGTAIGAEALTAALNERPSVNGLTALHDSVLRASTAGADRIDGYLEQIRWFVEKGARSDIPDFAGVTQRNIAERVADEKRKAQLLDALEPHRG